MRVWWMHYSTILRCETCLCFLVFFRFDAHDNIFASQKKIRSRVCDARDDVLARHRVVVTHIIVPSILISTAVKQHAYVSRCVGESKAH